MSITTRGIICVILMAAGATASAGPDIEVNYPVYDLGAVTGDVLNLL